MLGAPAIVLGAPSNTERFLGFDILGLCPDPTKSTLVIRDRGMFMGGFFF